MRSDSVPVAVALAPPAISGTLEPLESRTNIPNQPGAARDPTALVVPKLSVPLAVAFAAKDPSGLPDAIENDPVAVELLADGVIVAGPPVVNERDALAAALLEPERSWLAVRLSDPVAAALLEPLM